MKIIKFETDHCPMCYAMEESLKALNVDVIHVNAEEDATQTSYFDIRSVPTLVMINDEGYEIKRTGFIPLTELKKWVEK